MKQSENERQFNFFSTAVITRTSALNCTPLKGHSKSLFDPVPVLTNLLVLLQKVTLSIKRKFGACDRCLYKRVSTL